eukprot:TRINITY_DN2563_c0_g2_i3.p1 TRINITY_DN2563_c0_g2~~TRINITY_DN2563_c0_g2_i3.p1  ORF type:complete len:201 (+),score=85.03 TRINITY_DN2563_c0_g2_i3:179-781(+)
MIEPSDINSLMWPYYDPSLLLKLLDFHLKEKVYDQKAVLEQRAKVLSATRLDSAFRSALKDLDRDPPSDYELHLKEAKESRKKMEEELREVLEALREEEAVKMLSGEKEMKLKKIVEDIEIDEKVLSTLFEYAKMLYDSGEYEEAVRLLYFFELESNNKEDIISSLWGQLGGYIVLDQKQKSCHAFIRLKDAVDSLVFLP